MTWRIEEFSLAAKPRPRVVEQRVHTAQRVWTEDEEKELMAGIHSYGFLKAFAKRCGRSYGSVCGKAKRLSRRPSA